MHMNAALTAADAALDDLRADADFAHAEHGDVYATSLMHYHERLSELLAKAFTLVEASHDATMNKRDRLAHEAHANDIAKNVLTDVTAVRANFATVVARGSVTKPGARGVVEAAIGQSLNKAEIWWDGRVRLGKLTTTEVVSRDTSTYRPFPTWVPWTAGSIAAGAVGLQAISTFF